MTKTTSPYVTRFAPSPTGYLHRGHALSALLAFKSAQTNGGRFLLRIEDIDATRCKEDYIEAIYDDLKWLGLSWETPVRRQSEHFQDYKTALDKLKAMGVLYPCSCTRSDISAQNPKQGLEGPIYPGTCKGHPPKADKPVAWRLDVSKARALIGDSPLVWHDALKGEQIANPEGFGDIVLARKDTPTSYHLSVVVDDALQGISHVIRGMDLFHQTHIHCLLQKLLNLKTPCYHHHALLLGNDGKKFSKSAQAESLKSLRERGVDPTSLSP